MYPLFFRPECPLTVALMIVALIAVVSIVALVQFAAFYWRATVAVTAAAPVSDRLRTAAGITNDKIEASDFGALLHLVEICPALQGDGPGIRLVRGYYLFLRILHQLAGPAMGGWFAEEMTTCTRYVAARLDQRILQNRTIWNTNSA